MPNIEVIENLYMENLERDIITEIANRDKIKYTDAMAKYYNSKIAKLVENKSNDVQYLDYKYLAELI